MVRISVHEGEGKTAASAAQAATSAPIPPPNTAAAAAAVVPAAAAVKPAAAAAAAAAVTAGGSDTYVAVEQLLLDDPILNPISDNGDTGDNLESERRNTAAVKIQNSFRNLCLHAKSKSKSMAKIMAVVTATQFVSRAAKRKIANVKLQVGLLSIDDRNHQFTADVCLFLHWKPTHHKADKAADGEGDDSDTEVEIVKMMKPKGWQPAATLINVDAQHEIERSHFENRSTGARFLLINWIATFRACLQLKYVCVYINAFLFSHKYIYIYSHMYHSLISIVYTSIHNALIIETFPSIDNSWTCVSSSPTVPPCLGRLPKSG